MADRLLEYRSHRWDQALLDTLAAEAPENLPQGDQPQTSTVATQPPASNAGARHDPSQLLSAGLEKWKELMRPGESAKVEAERAVGRFIELFGDKPVALITRDNLVDYKEFIAKMPMNLSLPKIRKSGMSLSEAVEKAQLEKPDGKVLSSGSVKKDLGALSAIFSALEEARWIVANPGLKIRVSGYSKKKKGQRNPRLPLRPGMMKKLFASTLFTGCAGQRDIQRTREGPYVFQDELYWTYLFGATAGPRLEEVGQILLDDIEVVEEDGLPPVAGIYMTGTGVDQSAKTDESIRIIIVHPKLIELGFLDFVAERRASGATRLFDLPQSKLGTWTKELSRRVNRYLDRVIIDDKRYVWYSMRHEFADRSEITLTPELSKKIMGHARGRLYGLGAPLHHAAKELEKLDLSFIEWERLKAAAGRESTTPTPFNTGFGQICLDI